MTFGVLGVSAEVHKKFAELFEKITSFMFIRKIWQQWIRQNKLHFLLRIQRCIFNMVSQSSNANILFLFRHFILLFFTPVDISVANDQRYQQTMSIDSGRRLYRSRVFIRTNYRGFYKFIFLLIWRQAIPFYVFLYITRILNLFVHLNFP